MRNRKSAESPADRLKTHIARKSEKKKINKKTEELLRKIEHE